MVIFSEEKWRRLGMKMVQKSRVSEEEAEIIVDVLVTGSLRGIDSHGVRALPVFTEKKGRSRMRIVKEAPATAILDAGQTFGPISAKKAMEIAIEKARTQGIAACSVMNGEWIVNLFYYPLLAVQDDMIGIVVAREGPVCAPWGGTQPVGGTNPMSVAIPADKENPIVLDFATTMVAQGHVKTYLLEDKPIPEGWLIDRLTGASVHGYDLTLDKLDEFWKSEGALQPFGTYKGYGINLVIDILGGALNLTGTGSRAKGQGAFMTAINISAFVSVEEFKQEVDRLITDVKSSPVRPGFSEVLVPGEREYRIMAEREKNGIPVDDTSWSEIKETCKRLAIDVDKIMR